MNSNKIVNNINNLCNHLNLHNYIGIIVYGSYISQSNNYLSDLDVMIIMDDYATQDYGSLMIDNVRVEFFIQDIKRLYELIKKEIENNDPSHLTKFATCEILYDANGMIKDFIDYAKSLYNTKIMPSFNDDDKFSIFSINNRLEDLESLINEDSFYAVYYMILEKIRLLYAKINGIIELPIMKIEKLYKNREFAKKYIASSIHKLPDEDFINLYLNCLKIDNRDVMLDNIKRLYTYSFQDLDFDPNNFCLKYTKKPPFKV